MMNFIMTDCKTKTGGLTGVFLMAYDITKHYDASDLKKNDKGEYVVKRKYGKFTRASKDATEAYTTLIGGQWFNVKGDE